MNQTWTDLCQNNVDHFENHPSLHIIVPTIMVLGMVVGLNYISRKMAERELKAKGINLG